MRRSGVTNDQALHCRGRQSCRRTGGCGGGHEGSGSAFCARLPKGGGATPSPLQEQHRAVLSTTGSRRCSPCHPLGHRAVSRQGYYETSEASRENGGSDEDATDVVVPILPAWRVKGTVVKGFGRAEDACIPTPTFLLPPGMELVVRRLVYTAVGHPLVIQQSIQRHSR